MFTREQRRSAACQVYGLQTICMPACWCAALIPPESDLTSVCFRDLLIETPTELSSRQHWGRQSVAVPLAKMATSAHVAAEGTAGSLDTSCEGQSESMLDSNANKAHDAKHSQAWRSNSRTGQKRCVPPFSATNHYNSGICIGSLERSWSAMSLL